MAAGLVDLRSAGRIDVRSAGSAPAAEINPAVMEAMAEIGVDSHASSRSLSRTMLFARRMS